MSVSEELLKVLYAPCGDVLKAELIKQLKLVDGFTCNMLMLRPGIGPGDAERLFGGPNPGSIPNRLAMLGREMVTDFNRPVPFTNKSFESVSQEEKNRAIVKARVDGTSVQQAAAELAIKPVVVPVNRMVEDKDDDEDIDSPSAGAIECDVDGKTYVTLPKAAQLLGIGLPTCRIYAGERKWGRLAIPPDVAKRESIHGRSKVYLKEDVLRGRTGTN